MAEAAERDEVGAVELALETIPVGLVAQGGRRRAVGAGDAVVVGEDGVAVDFDSGRRHGSRCVKKSWRVKISAELLYQPRGARRTKLDMPP